MRAVFIVPNTPQWHEGLIPFRESGEGRVVYGMREEKNEEGAPYTGYVYVVGGRIK